MGRRDAARFTVSSPPPPPASHAVARPPDTVRWPGDSAPIKQHIDSHAIPHDRRCARAPPQRRRLPRNRRPSPRRRTGHQFRPPHAVPAGAKRSSSRSPWRSQGDCGFVKFGSWWLAARQPEFPCFVDAGRPDRDTSNDTSGVHELDDGRCAHRPRLGSGSGLGVAGPPGTIGVAGSSGVGTSAGSSGSAGVSGSGTAGDTGASGTAGVAGSLGWGTSSTPALRNDDVVGIPIPLPTQRPVGSSSDPINSSQDHPRPPAKSSWRCDLDQGERPTTSRRGEKPRSGTSSIPRRRGHPRYDAQQRPPASGSKLPVPPRHRRGVRARGPRTSRHR
jgi:hypothetical protein